MRGRRIAHPRGQREHHTGPSSVDRGRRGFKHHLIVDAHGIPLAVKLPGGNRQDVTQLLPLLDAVPVGAEISVTSCRRSAAVERSSLVGV